MEEDLQEVDSVQVCVGGMIGLMEISASMETTRIRDSLVSLGGGWKGVAGTRGRRKAWLWRGALCAAVNSRGEPWATRLLHCRCAAGNFKERGMIFARRSIMAC